MDGHTCLTSFDNTPEFIIAEIRHKIMILLIAIVYRRPNAASPEKFFETLSPFLATYKTIIITGDFNANLQKPRSPDTRILSELVKSRALSFVSRSPTHHLFHHNSQSHTTLHLFISKKSQHITSLSQSDAPFVAGHDFIELAIPFKLPGPSSRSLMKQRDEAYKKCGCSNGPVRINIFKTLDPKSLIHLTLQRINILPPVY